MTGRKRRLGEPCDETGSGSDVCDDVNAACVAGQCSCTAGYTRVDGGVCSKAVFTLTTLCMISVSLIQLLLLENDLFTTRLAVFSI